MTPDPYLNSAGSQEPSSWNRYSYVLGNPINYRDPKGLDNCGVAFSNAGRDDRIRSGPSAEESSDDGCAGEGGDSPNEGSGGDSGVTFTADAYGLSDSSNDSEDYCSLNPNDPDCYDPPPYVESPQQPTKPTSPKKQKPAPTCPDYMKNFFSNIGIFQAMAKQLNTNVDFLLALSARETGYLNGPQYNKNSNNLFGASSASEVPLTYDSLQDSANAWVQRWGSDVQGVTSATTFFQDLVKDNYNTHPGYASNMAKQVQDTQKWKAICQ